MWKNGDTASEKNLYTHSSNQSSLIVEGHSPHYKSIVCLKSSIVINPFLPPESFHLEQAEPFLSYTRAFPFRLMNMQVVPGPQ
jgi:hypothetical protein